jgi:chloramphenicol-sensitive protein RarD
VNGSIFESVTLQTKHFFTLKLNQYYLSAISAFVIWGFISLPIKFLSEYSSAQILFARVLVSLVLLLGILLLFRRKALVENLRQFKQSTATEKRKTVLFIVLSGVLLTANWLSFIYVLNHISVQAGSFAYLICPILTALLGFVLLKEPLKPQQWLAIAISIFSCYLIGVDSLRNLLFSLLVGFTYALYLITQRVLRQYDKIVLLTLQVFFSFAIIFALGESFRGAMPVASTFYGWIFVLSLVFTVIPLFLNTYALKELKSGTIGILMYINPVINFAVAFVYYGEQASFPRIVAYILILLSIIIYNLNISFPSLHKKEQIPS